MNGTLVHWCSSSSSPGHVLWNQRCSWCWCCSDKQYTAVQQSESLFSWLEGTSIRRMACRYQQMHTPANAHASKCNGEGVWCVSQCGLLCVALCGVATAMPATAPEPVQCLCVDMLHYTCVTAPPCRNDIDHLLGGKARCIS